MLPLPFQLQLPVLHSSEGVTRAPDPVPLLASTMLTSLGGQPAPPDSGLVCSSDEPIPMGIPGKEMPALPSSTKMAAVLSKPPTCLKKTENTTTTTAIRDGGEISKEIFLFPAGLKEQAGPHPDVEAFTGGSSACYRRTDPSQQETQPTRDQERKLFISGAKETKKTKTKNRDQTLQLLEAVWASWL